MKWHLKQMLAFFVAQYATVAALAMFMGADWATGLFTSFFVSVGYVCGWFLRANVDQEEINTHIRLYVQSQHWDDWLDQGENHGHTGSGPRPH